MDDDAPERPTEKADAPEKSPASWRTVENEAAGFTIATPKTWAAATKRGATLIRSKDELVAVTIAADRSSAGRDTEPGPYAGKVVAALPGFQGDVSVKDREVAGSALRDRNRRRLGHGEDQRHAPADRGRGLPPAAAGDLFRGDLPQRAGAAGAGPHQRGQVRLWRGHLRLAARLRLRLGRRRRGQLLAFCA